MRIAIQKLRSLILLALRHHFDEADSRAIIDVILYAEMSGKTSHGIVRLLEGNLTSILSQKLGKRPRILHLSKCSSIIQGDHSAGMLLGVWGMREALRLAKKGGCAVVGTRGSISSSGSLAYYAEYLAERNLIAILCAQSPKSTAPYGSIEPLFGTNPLTFGIPSNPHPLIFDMATSAATFGTLLKARALHTKLPRGVAIDARGNPTRDPLRALNGALLTFDKSYKSSGLAMMVEILAGALTHASFTGLHTNHGWGNLFIVFSPALLTPLSVFKTNVQHLTKAVRHAKTKSGEKVQIPGERSRSIRLQCVRTGWVDIDEKLLTQLQAYVERAPPPRIFL